MNANIITDPSLHRLSKKFLRAEINRSYWTYRPMFYTARNAYQPWQYIGMILIMLDKKFSSFRHLHKELNIKANSHLRRFCGFRFGHVPARSRLQEFLKTLTPEMWDEIMNVIWQQFANRYPEMKQFPLIIGVDTMDQPVNSRYDRKSKSFTDSNARFGYRTSKLGKTSTFGGYKKHTLKALFPSLNMIIPIYSRVESADVKENIPMVDYFRLLEKFPLFDKQTGAFGLGDAGYIDANSQKEIRETLNISFITGIRCNTAIDSEIYAPDGHPTCPEDHRLIWMGKDNFGAYHQYDGDSHYCNQCPRSGTCPKQFDLPVGDHETLLGNIPYHRTKEIRKRLRPQIEITNYWDKWVCLDEVRFKCNVHITTILARAYDVYKLIRYLGDNVSYYRAKKTQKPDKAKQLEFQLAA